MNHPSDFHAFREGGLGGSDAPIIMKASPWSTRFELWLRKTRLIRPQPQTYPMKRGLRYEPLARAAYERITGIAMPPDRIIHPTRPALRGNFDGINHEIKRPIEIKCPGKDDHEFAKTTKRVPKKYIWQCRHLLAVPEYEAMDYFSFDVRGLDELMKQYGWEIVSQWLSMRELEKRSVIIEVKRDLAEESLLLEQEGIFWDHVLTNVPPPFDEELEAPPPAAAGLSPTHVHYKHPNDIFKSRKNRARVPKAKKCPHCKRPVISGANVHSHCERIMAKKNFQLTLIKGVSRE